MSPIRGPFHLLVLFSGVPMKPASCVEAASGNLNPNVYSEQMNRNGPGKARSRSPKRQTISKIQTKHPEGLCGAQLDGWPEPFGIFLVFRESTHQQRKMVEPATDASRPQSNPLNNCVGGKKKGVAGGRGGVRQWRNIVSALQRARHPSYLMLSIKNGLLSMNLSSKIRIDITSSGKHCLNGREVYYSCF